MDWSFRSVAMEVLAVPWSLSSQAGLVVVVVVLGL
jgi:hypothetical protein